MKILQVINCFQRSGGAEKFVLDLSVALKRINNDIEVLSLVSPNKDNNDFIDILKKHKIKFHCLHGSNIRSLNVIQNLGTFFKSNHYDIVHCHLFPALYYCALYRSHASGYCALNSLRLAAASALLSNVVATTRYILRSSFFTSCAS